MSRRKRKPASIKEGVRGGADEALANLVQQFSDPFAFLRELIQNSLDAGSLRIDVRLEWSEPAAGKERGLLSVAVIDTGEGMTAEVIDNYLLTLFRSHKEDDLTKIGKFGIGFVSVFAVDPDLVLVETARAGEAWRILFHKDRSFERVALSEPMEGTRVEVLRYTDQGEAQRFAQSCDTALRRWCRHAHAEIWLHDLEGRSHRIDGPLALDKEETLLAVEHREDTSHVVLGLPRDGAGVQRFYNQGLLLHERSATEVETPFLVDLGNLCFKINAAELEHTLTRDKVIDDEHYYEALALIARVAREKLVPEAVGLLARRAKELANRDGQLPTAEVEAYFSLLDWCLARSGHAAVLGTALVLVPLTGEPLPWSALAQALKTQALPMARLPSRVVRAYQAERGPVFHEQVAQGLLRLLTKHLPKEAEGLSLLFVPDHYLAPIPSERPNDAVLAHLRELLGSASLYRRTLHLGRLEEDGGLAGRRVYVNQEEPFRLSPVLENKPGSLFGGARAIVLNEAHPLVNDALALGQSDPLLAATVLARVLTLGEVGGEHDPAKLVAQAIAARSGETHEG